MTSPGTNPKKRRRWAWLLAGLVVVIVVVVVAPPTVRLARKRQAILAALQSATAIRLEEFNPGYSERDQILTTRELRISDRSQLADALPTKLAAAIPGVFNSCYVPHHRVILIAADRSEITLGVCFMCNTMSFKDD